MVFSLCSPACSQQTIYWELRETEALSVCHRAFRVGRDPLVLLFLHSSAVPIAIFLAYQGIAFPFVSHIEFTDYTVFPKQRIPSNPIIFFLHSNAQMAMNGILLGNGAKVQ